MSYEPGTLTKSKPKPKKRNRFQFELSTDETIQITSDPASQTVTITAPAALLGELLLGAQESDRRNMEMWHARGDTALSESYGARSADWGRIRTHIMRLFPSQPPHDNQETKTK